jgi:hypothetical protein
MACLCLRASPPATWALGHDGMGVSLFKAVAIMQDPLCSTAAGGCVCACVSVLGGVSWCHFLQQGLTHCKFLLHMFGTHALQTYLISVWAMSVFFFEGGGLASNSILVCYGVLSWRCCIAVCKLSG